MGIPFEPLRAIIAILLIAFLFASLPQVNHKMRYVVLYVIAILMLLAAIPICEHIVKLPDQSSKDNYLIVLIFDIAVGYFCMHIAAWLKFNLLKYKNKALENALEKKGEEKVSILLEHQIEKQQTLRKEELEWDTEKIKIFTKDEQKAILACACTFAGHNLILSSSITIQPKDKCSQQELMHFICSAFFNMVKNRSDIASFLY